MTYPVNGREIFSPFDWRNGSVCHSVSLIYIRALAQVCLTEGTQSAVIEDYVSLSNAFLEAHREELRPRNDIGFITELLMRVTTSTVNDYAVRSPRLLDGPELTEALIDLIGIL